MDRSRCNRYSLRAPIAIFTFKRGHAHAPQHTRHHDLAATLALGSGSALAQAATDFPEGAEPMTPEALREALSGKVFIVKPVNGWQWRWQFNTNGYAYLNIGQRNNSSQWSTKDSSLCQSGSNTGCNEMRRKDNVLYLKRDNGEVVAFQPE